MSKIIWSASKEAQEMDIGTSCFGEKGHEVGKESQQMHTAYSLSGTVLKESAVLIGKADKEISNWTYSMTSATMGST